jgi:hypothetical protein
LNVNEHERRHIWSQSETEIIFYMGFFLWEIDRNIYITTVKTSFKWFWNITFFSTQC